KNGVVKLGVNLKIHKKPVRVRVGKTAAGAVVRWLQENEEKALKMRMVTGEYSNSIRSSDEHALHCK
ncbi:MAG: hypothetical protein SGPRY_000208, partial [Prymnesium sp.]